MARVYSTRFFAGTSFSGEVVSFTVPAGNVAVVRDLTILGFGDEESLVEFYIDLGGGVDVRFAYLSIPSGDASNQWTGRVVLNAGETLNGACTTAGSVDLTASGYLLGLP